MTADLSRETMTRAYALWAPVYDAVCGPIFESGRKSAAAAARRRGRDILEIGVGTGLSFADYGPQNNVTGIDLSPEMIAKAFKRKAEGNFPWIGSLEVMDAQALAYAPATFDVVVGQFVITLVENPERVLDECARVLRPGGSLILVNHLFSETGAMAFFERTLARPARRIGLRPDFPFARFDAWMAARCDISLIERRTIPPLNWFTLLRFEKYAG